MSDCAFCKIATNGQSWVLKHEAVTAEYEIVSFKPFGALNPGHRIFVPVRHVVGAEEDPELTGRCFREAAIWAGQRRGWAMGEGPPFNLHVNSGHAAGQRVDHLHIHYVPRASGDGIRVLAKGDQ